MPDIPNQTIDVQSNDVMQNTLCMVRKQTKEV